MTATDAALIALGERFEKFLLEPNIENARVLLAPTLAAALEIPSSGL